MMAVCFDDGSDHRQTLNDLLTKTVTMLCKNTLASFSPNKRFFVKGLLCLSSKEGDLWHFSVEDEFDTFDGKSSAFKRNEPGIDNKECGLLVDDRKQPNIVQRERVNPSQKRKRKASHQFQESKAVHLLNGYTSSGCEEETPIKKESPYIHKDRMQDVGIDFSEKAGAKVKENHNSIVEVIKTEEELFIVKEEPPDQYTAGLGQPVFPAVMPLGHAPDFAFPSVIADYPSTPTKSGRDSSTSSPQRCIEKAATPRSDKQMASAVLQCEGSFVTTRMVSRRTGWKVANIKTGMLSLSSSVDDANHIGTALNVGRNQSLVFFKCPPEIINNQVLATYGVSTILYKKSYYSTPKHQLSDFHYSEILKNSPYFKNHENSTWLSAAQANQPENNLEAGALNFPTAKVNVEAEKHMLSHSEEEDTSQASKGLHERNVTLTQPLDATNGEDENSEEGKYMTNGESIQLQANGSQEKGHSQYLEQLTSLVHSFEDK